MKQMNEFGQFLKSKYEDFLTTSYDRSRVFARSTDYDRTLQTVNVVLNGLYPPNSDQKWTSDAGLFNWLPIPVHTANLSGDRILNANADCPRYEQLKNEARNSQLYLSRQEANQQLINSMKNFSGINDLNYYTMWKIADKAFVEVGFFSQITC